jgi:tetratricopeptide (TPR) repeat protein
MPRTVVQRTTCALGRRRIVQGLALMALCAAPMIASGPLAAAPRPWVEVRSPNFVVISDAGDKNALRAAWQFEQVRAVLERLWPWARWSGSKPFMIFAARDENTFKSLAPQFWETKGGLRPSSLFVTGPDRHYVALRSDAWEPNSLEANPYFQSYWSYVYITLQSLLGTQLPLWLGRGLSDVFANTIVREKDLQVGRVVPWHMTTLRSRSRLTLAQVLAVDRGSPYMTRQDQAPVFNAAAWALVHYLAFGENAANLPKLNKLLQTVTSGGDANAALEQIYGPLDRLQDTVSTYITRTMFTYKIVPLDVNVSEGGFGRRPLSSAESAADRAALHAVMQRPLEARALVAEAVREDPALASPYEVEGLLSDMEGKPDAARAAYAKAAELGSTNAYAYYRYAQLSWSETPDRTALEKMERSLEQTIKLDSNFAPGYAFLADVTIDLEKPDKALGFARRAVALEPESSSNHVVVARALARLSRPAEALPEAEKALALAKSPQERQRAEQLLARLKGLPK